jgi:cell division protein FtsW
MSTLTIRRQRRRAPAPAAVAVPGAREERWEGPLLLALTLLLSLFGLLTLYSASAYLAHSSGLAPHYFAWRQLGGVLVGIVVMVAVARLDYRHLRRLAWPLLIGVTVLLVLVVLPGTEAIAPRINGARRWLTLGITFQPSEFATLIVALWTAALVVKKQERLHSLRRGLLPFLIVWGVLAVLVCLQPNLSSALLLIFLSALVVFAGGGRIGHFVLLGMVAVPLVWTQIQSALYRSNRLAAFLNPGADPSGMSYQMHQSLVAVGSGGLTGLGFGQSRQKFGFLPEPHNDFIFAMVAEEWGLLGVVLIVGVFACIAAVGLRIASRAPDLFGYLAGIGMTLLIALPATIHMGVVMGLLPTTGVTLPFVSYGRSALLTAFLAVGVLLSIHRVSRREAAR